MKRALLIGAGTLLLPTLALAQSADGGAGDSKGAESSVDAEPAPPGVHIVEDAEPKPPFVPRARDVLGSHVLVGAAFGPAWSLGRLGSSTAAARGLGTGMSLRADAGFGLSRSVVLGAWGSYAAYADGDRCSPFCSGKAFAVGPYVRYHLSQGLRFDPWFTLGGGFRQVAYEDSSGTRQTFRGMEWLHLELGADYYLFSGLGLGPYGAIGLSSYSRRPESAGSASVNTELSVGLRFLFDAPGR
jgi:hypothetical protein